MDLFVPRIMDCDSTLTIDCLSYNILNNQTISSTPVQFTCHTSQNKIEVACNSINLIFKRNLKISKTKKATSIQIIALAKEPCTDDDIFFQCPNDYPNSCIDKKLQCNGRSECPSGDDERNCHPTHRDGIPIIVIVLIILASLFLCCVLSIVLICYCCRVACLGIIRRFGSRKGNKSIEKGDVTISGEDAGLMKGLTTPMNVIENVPKENNEPETLVIDSTKPIYPRLE